MKRLNLLLVDDDEDDRMFFEDALAEVAPESTIMVKKDGEETLSFLSQSNIVIPDIIFLDLNMPFMDGAKCLEEIRKNELMKNVFIVINTTTASSREIDNAFEKGANLFLIKPSSYGELKQSISAIIELDLIKMTATRDRSRFVLSKGIFRNT